VCMRPLCLCSLSNIMLTLNEWELHLGTTYNICLKS
jgi:hypothetical protein